MPSASKPRRYPRIDLPRGFPVAWRSGGQQEVSRVGTVGMGGLFIYTPEPPPVGTLLVLLFDLPGGEVRARAVVRDCRAGEGMGVEFTAMSFEARARLSHILRRLLRDVDC